MTPTPENYTASAIPLPNRWANNCCWRGGSPSAECGSSRFTTHLGESTSGTTTTASITSCRRTAPLTDLPIAGFLKDLKNRGLLDETLVIWGGEFGRTPTAEGSDGREHHPFGFTMWLAGGGIKGGHIHGATDEYGWHAVQDKVHVHDLHATILHLLGLDHERLTYRYGGRDFRLTDVYGRVVREILA